MPNLGKMLKEEFKRLARLEIKTALSGLRKNNSSLKRTLAELRKRLAAMESLYKQSISKSTFKTQSANSKEDEIRSARITSRMIRSIRDRLGLSQNAFAKLIGVSSQAVYQWERATGRLKFRGDTKAKIIAIRRLGKREAKKMFASIDA